MCNIAIHANNYKYSNTHQSLPTLPNAPSSSLGPVGIPISSNVRGCALRVSCCGSMSKVMIKLIIRYFSKLKTLLIQ